MSVHLRSSDLFQTLLTDFSKEKSLSADESMLEHAVTPGLEMWENKYKDVKNLKSRMCSVLLAQEAGIYNFDNYKVFAES